MPVIHVHCYNWVDYTLGEVILAHIYPARPAAWRSRWPLIVIALLLVGGLLLAVTRFMNLPWVMGNDPNAITVQYTTERGEGVAEAIVNSPLRIAVRIPWSDGSQKGTISVINVELLDEAGNKAQFGSDTPNSLQLEGTPQDIRVWEYVGSVPSRPGAYRARLHLKTPYDQSRQQDYDLPGPPLRALADTGPTLSSGYVFNTESNLWIMSTDGANQKRLTYFPPQDERADNPAWSPDGSLIAFAYTPKQPTDQIPVSDIWVIKPDGSDARQLVAHSPGESLLYPAWSNDGKYLYFTVEGSPDSQSPMGLPVTPNDNRRIDRVEIGNAAPGQSSGAGARSTWMPSAQMAAGGPSDQIVYLELVPTGPDTDPSTIPQKIFVSRSDGSDKRQLVDENTYSIMYAPQMSPDGKWVVFSATNTPPPPKMGFDFLEWLGIQPKEASAHVVPWDLYLISTNGGTPTRLTTFEEDQPYPTWLDSSTVALMGALGTYRVNVGMDGKPAGQPVKMRAGTLHGGLTWHAP